MESRSRPPADSVVRAPLVLHFEGPAFSRERLSARDLVSFISHLQTAVNRVASLQVGGSDSLVRGRKPSEIGAECTLDIVSVQGGGSVTVLCDLPPLNQQRLPGYDDLGETAVRALVEGIGVITETPTSVPAGYDKGVLLALREFGRVFESGSNKVSLDFKGPGQKVSRAYTRATYDHIVQRIRLPVKNRREVEGRLLMADFKESGLRCRIHPPVGSAVLCEFEEVQREAVLSALTRYVRVVGEATEIDEAVKVLQIEDIEILDGDGVLSITGPSDPGVATRASDLDEIAAALGAKPIADPRSLYGDFWPAEESIDDFLGALRKWRLEKSEGSRA
jgi:hypothetical protein